MRCSKSCPLLVGRDEFWIMREIIEQIMFIKGYDSLRIVLLSKHNPCSTASSILFSRQAIIYASPNRFWVLTCAQRAQITSSSSQWQHLESLSQVLHFLLGLRQQAALSMSKSTHGHSTWRRAEKSYACSSNMGKSSCTNNSKYVPARLLFIPVHC